VLASDNQPRHHQPRRDILILFVARLSSRSSRHIHDFLLSVGSHSLKFQLARKFQGRSAGVKSGATSEVLAGIALKSGIGARTRAHGFEFSRSLAG